MADDLSQDRKDALALARSFGWEVSRKSKTAWVFRRPDTGGLWDVFTISHQFLSITAVLRKFEAYEPDLAEAINKARLQVHAAFLKNRRPLSTPTPQDRKDTPDER